MKYLVKEAWVYLKTMHMFPGSFLLYVHYDQRMNEVIFISAKVYILTIAKG